MDIINYLDGYPAEDTDQTIPLQRWAQGGNAANNCVVLNQLRSAFGEKINNFEFELFGSFGTDLASNFVRQYLTEVHGVKLGKSPIKATGGDGKRGLLSASCIVVNRLTGSRTIVHATNDIPDINFDDFSKADLQFDDYDWINFENRGTSETIQMVDLVLSQRKSKKPIISV